MMYSGDTPGDTATATRARQDVCGDVARRLDEADVGFTSVDAASGRELCVAYRAADDLDAMGEEIALITCIYADVCFHGRWKPAVCTVVGQLPDTDQQVRCRIEREWLPDDPPMDYDDDQVQTLLDRVARSVERAHTERIDHSDGEGG